MKQFLSTILFSCGVLIFGLAANAQAQGPGPYYPQRDDPNYRNDRYDRNYPSRDGYDDGRYSRQRGYYGDQSRYRGNQDSLIGRVMADIDRAASNARLDGHEGKHFDEAVAKLQEFQVRWAQGKFDGGKLDKAIQNLEHLSDADRVSGRDREMLARDINDLRQLRSTRGRLNYGSGDYRDDRYNQNRRYDSNWR